ncbi:primase-helicase family protein [Pseudooceanicola atlanticus]|uniref:primase-helicase family protein n=1 Tax=Pseudooceanicola atlanticus TaxID=1461694 RepID=UPI0023529E8F|nr:DUF5906 domain-containing protein [Pseudooceanicola atlanticus]
MAQSAATPQEPKKLNDAELLGVDHPEMQEMLQRPFVAMTGDLYGARDRRNTQDGDWKRVELPLLGWMVGADKGDVTNGVTHLRPWGLTRHPEAKSKEGSSIVLADALDGARTDSAIQTMYAVGLDIDSGAKLKDVLDKLEELGLFAIVYTSFSHGKSELVLKHDDIMRKLKLDDSPTRPQIQEYLREHHKDRFDASFINSIEIIETRKQTKDGLRTVLKTEPLDKFRVILPLWEPVELADLAPTVNQWKDVWADAVTGVAVNMLGVNFDSTSCDVNRLFYTPRHPEGADWYSAVVMGRPLRFEEIKPHSKTEYQKSRGVSDPFAAGTVGADGSGDREQFVTEDGLNLNRWHRTHKDRFLMADVIESFVPDKVRVAGGERVGTVHLECPFEHEHSSEGGTATLARNPDANEFGVWSVACQHDSCRGRDKLEFLKAMLDENWFPEDVLTDEDWLIPLPDEDLTPIVSDADPIPLSAPLWEDGLVTDGFCKAKKVPEIRDQIRRNLRGRVSHVIVDGGKGKLFLHPKRGRLPEIWDDTALDKFYRNSRVQYDRKGSKKPGLINPAKEFFEDEQRVTYAGTQFEPDPAKADPHKFNLFNGFPVEPAPGDWSLLRNHIQDNLVAGNGSTPEDDEHLFNYFMTWLADLFQNPGHKKGCSVAILGEQGVGKSKLFDWVRKALGDYAIKVSSKKHLVGNFNSHLDSKLLVVAEEAFWSGDKEAASILKDFITSDTYTVERKGVDAAERRNLIRTAFVTNSDWAVPTDDNADARRFLVLRAGTAQKQNRAYFAAIDTQMRAGGLAAMVHELMHWDPANAGMTFDDLRAAPWTAARAEQASYSASPAKSSLLQIVDDGFFTDRDGIDVVLSDTKPTRVQRADLLFAIQGKAAHGGARKAARKAIEQILGVEAWHDLKHPFDDGERHRYIEFPPMDGLRDKLRQSYL